MLTCSKFSHNFEIILKIKIWSGKEDSHCRPIMEEISECYRAALYARNPQLSANAYQDHLTVLYGGHLLDRPRKELFNKTVTYKMLPSVSNEYEITGVAQIVALPSTGNKRLEKKFGIPIQLLVKQETGGVT